MRSLQILWMGLLMITDTMTPRAVRGADLPLTADWNGVRATRAYPVTAGLPLGRGELRDPRRATLTSGDQNLPLQTEVLAWWPDGSVKWILLDFQAPPGTKDFVLKYGSQVPAGGEAEGITVTQKPGSITVDTGLVKFTVRSDGSGFIDELSFAGNKVFASEGKRLNFMDMIHTDSPADYHPMDRYLNDGKPDPSRVTVTKVTLENGGPLRATVLIDGKYKYKHVGSTITGTDVKGDCPFRIRIHAYAGQSFLKVEHFFYYEGDGDHDFTKSLGLKVPLPPSADRVRYIDTKGKVIEPGGTLSGLYQQSADAFQVWKSEGTSAKLVDRGDRFEGVIDISTEKLAVAVGVKDFWQNAPKALHADLKDSAAGIYFFPPEGPPLDYRRHAREWSVGETGSPNDPRGGVPKPFDRRSFPNYRLASKGVGKTHYALVYFHDPTDEAEDVLGVYKLFNQRPLLWASPKHYASTLALGRYREPVPGEHDDIEEALDTPIKFWRFSQERFRWYGFWIYGQVCQDFNAYQQHGRWVRDFGRWGWALGDSVGRLAYTLMLQAVRKTQREDLEFAEKYLYNVHDVASTHTPAYPHHYGNKFIYIKGASHRHGAWPWAGPYCGARGSHPVGAKIFYFLTGEGHAKDILEEMTQLAIKNPHGGEGDGPLGINIQCFLYQWEATGDEKWLEKIKNEIETNDGLRTGTSGWNVMMPAAFGIYNGLEEYMDLTGDYSHKDLAGDFADRAMPAQMRGSWTFPDGYYRVYACGYNFTGNKKYLRALRQTLPIFVRKVKGSAAGTTPEKDWPGPTGGPRAYCDSNVIRDIPFALYSLHNEPIVKEEK